MKMWIALAIFAVAILAAIWQVSNIRGLKARGRRRAPTPDKAQRRGDTRVFKGAEKKLYTESQKLLAEGKVQPAARILEQLNMPREAIQALEDAGLIHEAAKILLRMQRANRAGVVYARHGMWENAAQCFKMANMPLEVAKCAREAGNLALAAEYFEKVGRYEDAASCYEQQGDLHRAARLYASAGQKDRAMALYNKFAAQAQNLAAVEFQDDEVDQIMDYLGDGHVDAGLADVAVSRNKLNDVILNLVTKGFVKQATEIYARANSDIGPMLMAEVNYQNRSATCLAEVFNAVSNFHYAGMVYERMSSFPLAAEAFEKAEDFERASYCFERSGNDAKAKQLKEKAKLAPYKGRPGNSAFALGSVPSSSQNNFGSAQDNESTAVVNMASGRPAAPTNPPPAPRAAPPLPPTPLAGNFSMSTADEDEALPAPPSPFTIKTAEPRRGFDDMEPSPTADDETPAPSLPPPVARLAPGSAEHDEGRAIFHRAKFFADLDIDQKNRLWNIGQTLPFAADETLLTYNDEPKGIYVIFQGSVSCYKQAQGKEAYVDQMGEGESFGELWLLADQPTAVKFVATQDTKVRVITRDAFNDLLDKDGTIARKLYKRFTMRLLKRLLKPQNNKQNQQAS